MQKQLCSTVLGTGSLEIPALLFTRAVERTFNFKKHILSKKQFIFEVLMIKAVR